MDNLLIARLHRGGYYIGNLKVVGKYKSIYNMYKLDEIRGSVSSVVLIASFMGLILLGVGVYKFGNFNNLEPSGNNQLAANVSSLFSDNNTAILDHFDKENSLFGSISGALTYIDGPDGLGKAINFSTGSYAREKSLTFLSYGQNWTEGTVEFWVKPEQYPSGNKYLVHFNWNSSPNPSSGYLGDISLRSDGKISYHCGWGWNNVPTPTVVSNSSLPLNQWTHVAGVWSSSGGTKLYINNNLDAEISQGCASGSNGNIYPWLAGYGGFVGAIDELRISKVARSAPFYSGDPGAVSARTIKVTVPNGGETWQLGSIHTIQWTPYDPQQNLNVVPDVEAYLERLVNGSYVTVGKIIESGKASIHWAGDLDNYNNYPEPGNYYVRVVNSQTGESDRSDSPFKVVAKGTVKADLKINGSDGPISLPANGGTVTFSWTSSNADSCILYLNGLASDLTGLPTSGEKTIFLKQNTDQYDKYLSLNCSSAIGGAVDQVIIPLYLVEGSYVKINYPNGGEEKNISSKDSIDWNFSPDIDRFSIALYKNDAFFKWIASDLPWTQSGPGYISWVPSNYVSSSDIGGQVFKIYIIGYKSSGGTVEDKSDAPFTITTPTTATPSIKILSLNGGENFQQGQQLNIKWSTSPSDFNSLIGLELWTVADNGSLVYLENISESGVPNSGSYEWTIPASIKYLGDFKLRVIVNDAKEGTEDFSDAPFTIIASTVVVAPPSYSVSLESSSSFQASPRQVIRGSQVELARLRFTALNENIKINQIALQMSVSPSSLVGQRVTLWDGSIQVGTAQFGTNSLRNATSTLTGNFIIPANSSKILSLKGEIDSSTSVGSIIKVDYDGDNSGKNGNYGTTTKVPVEVIPNNPDTSSNGVIVVEEVTQEEPISEPAPITEEQQTIENLNNQIQQLLEVVAQLQAALNAQLQEQQASTPLTEVPQPTSVTSPTGGLVETFSYTWSRDLFYGLENDSDVMALQNALILEGVYQGPVTGNFLELTRQGVIEFQRKHGFDPVPDTGFVGSYTRQVLNNIYSK